MILQECQKKFKRHIGAEVVRAEESVCRRHPAGAQGTDMPARMSLHVFTPRVLGHACAHAPYVSMHTSMHMTMRVSMQTSMQAHVCGVGCL